MPVNADGGDYESQAGPTIDALLRGDLREVADRFPLMGPLAVLIRAPFVAAVYDADVRVVYLVGSLPCLLVFAAALIFLTRRLQERGAGPGALALVLALGNLAVFRAFHWGHPEDLMATGLLLGAALAALDRRPAPSAVLLGLALATKQWALLALVPVALMHGKGALRAAAIAAGIFVVLSAPLAIAAPDRFMALARATSNPEEFWRTDGRTGAPPAPGDTEPIAGHTPVTPANAGWPVASKRDQVRQGQAVRTAVVPDWVVRASHLLIAAMVVPLCWLWWRRGRPPEDLLAVLALVFLLRCLLEPINFDYYQLPFLTLLASWEAWTRRVPWLTVAAAAGMALTWWHPAGQFADLYEHALWSNATYLAWALPVAVALVLSLRQRTSPARWSPSRARAASVLNP